MIQSHKSKRALKKENLVNDFYHNWSIDKTCDTVTLESSHPLNSPNSYYYIHPEQTMFYTHECKHDEIAYFKVDMNLIDTLPEAFLGNI